jgi:hypothetical protein
MNHPTGDELLLLAYGELPGAAAAEIESHAAACPACRQQLADLERTRVALDVAMPARRGVKPAWAALALAAAAALAGLWLTSRQPSRPHQAWQPMTVWSTTAGYVAGGQAMVDIDARLTRLEQERHYGWPN